MKYLVIAILLFITAIVLVIIFGFEAWNSIYLMITIVNIAFQTIIFIKEKNKNS